MHDKLHQLTFSHGWPDQLIAQEVIVQRDTAATHPFSKEFQMMDCNTTQRHAMVRTLNLLACVKRDRHETALCVATGLIFAGLVVGYLWRHYA